MMIETTHTHETRYGKVSDYNRTRILNQVKQFIIADGGTIIDNDMIVYQYKAYTMETTPAKRAAVENLPPIMKTGYKYCGSGDTVKFILNGYYYSISYDDNPFFPITFSKIKIDENGDYIGKRYCYSNEPINDRQYKKDGTFAFNIGYDRLFCICSDDDIKEMAKYHYEQMKTVIIGGRESEIYSERKRVRNYYNGGYHYEKIYDRTKCNIYK